MTTVWKEQEHNQCSSGTTTFANIAADDDSISSFNTAVALPCHKIILSWVKTNQTIQSNLNTIMQELQTIKHQMNYGATHTPLMCNNGGHYHQSIQHNPYNQTCCHFHQLKSLCSKPLTTIHTNRHRTSMQSIHQRIPTPLALTGTISWEEVADLEWHRVDKDIGVEKEHTETYLEDTVEHKDLECRALIILIHSNILLQLQIWYWSWRPQLPMGNVQT